MAVLPESYSGYHHPELLLLYGAILLVYRVPLPKLTCNYISIALLSSRVLCLNGNLLPLLPPTFSHIRPNIRLLFEDSFCMESCER